MDLQVEQQGLELQASELYDEVMRCETELDRMRANNVQTNQHMHRAVFELLLERYLTPTERTSSSSVFDDRSIAFVGASWEVVHQAMMLGFAVENMVVRFAKRDDRLTARIEFALFLLRALDRVVHTSDSSPWRTGTC